MRKTARPLRVPIVLAGALAVIGFFYIFQAFPNNFDLLLSPQGSTRLSPLYLVKLYREKMQSLFVMGDIDKASWHATLAQKRLTEAQILKDHGLEKLSEGELNRAKKEQAAAMQLQDTIKDRTDTNYLQQQIQENQSQIESLEN